MGKVSSEKEGFPLALGICGDSVSGVACDHAPQDRAGISCSHHYLPTHVKHSLAPKGKVPRSDIHTGQRCYLSLFSQEQLGRHKVMITQNFVTEMNSDRICVWWPKK